MSFLIRPDYEAQIKQDLLDVILQGNDHIRLSAERAALAEMQSYLRGKYDLTKIFISVLEWQAGKQFNAGQAVWHQAAAAVPTAPVVIIRGVPQITEAPVLIYVASQAATGTVPGTEQAIWLLSDPRPPLLITYLIDLTLYLLHSGQNPRGIPQLRADRYEQALEWLNMCRTGKISPGLPLAPAILPDGSEDPESLRPRFSSLPKLRNAY